MKTMLIPVDMRRLPIVASAVALALALAAADARAQEEPATPEPEQEQQCRAILMPSDVNLGAEEEQTVRARLTQDIGEIKDVEVEEESGLQVALAEERTPGEGEETPEGPVGEPETLETSREVVTLNVGAEDAKKGDWTLTFKAQDGDKKCEGVLSVGPQGEEIPPQR